MGRMSDALGRLVARCLKEKVEDVASTPALHAMRHTLRPGDVLLVEGKTHISGAIKYLTQSTWSHAALYVGPIAGRHTASGEPHVLIEANIGEGVVSAPLSKYRDFHTRICRPLDLSATDRAQVCHFATARIGLAYDLKNVIDLARFLLPWPKRWRRMTTLGSRDPRRIICSTLIAQAFASVGFAILPQASAAPKHRTRSDTTEFTDATHCAPRDFDLSPYFEVIKPRRADARFEVPMESDGVTRVSQFAAMLSAREQVA
jgi:Permuted papain-like amidase enzyme, YaeF/YiiX, C92 family